VTQQKKLYLLLQMQKFFKFYFFLTEPFFFFKEKGGISSSSFSHRWEYSLLSKWNIQNYYLFICWGRHVPEAAPALGYAEIK